MSTFGGFAGLSENGARARLEQDGPNELPSQKKRGAVAIALEVVREPMFLMLVAAAALYLLMGEPADALMLLGFVFVVMGITIVQERRTERALDALRDLSSPRALVIRDGVQRRIPGREVVRGDIVVLPRATACPADAVLRQGINLSVDESLLTGESVPVRKAAVADAAQRSTGPAATTCRRSSPARWSRPARAIAEVLATGLAHRAGQDRQGAAAGRARGDAAAEGDRAAGARPAPWSGLPACALVVVVYGLTRGGSAAGLEGGAAGRHRHGHGHAARGVPGGADGLPRAGRLAHLAAAACSRAACRPSRRSGAATVLCVDKTGTLTLNQMTVRRLAARRASCVDLTPAGGRAAPRTFHALLEYAILASKRDPFDPMEQAIARGRRPAASAAPSTCTPNWTLVREYPLSPGAARRGARLAGAGAATSTSSPPRARPRPSPTCAT